jgi:hypothetical protein
LCTHYSSTEFTNPHGILRFCYNFSAVTVVLVGWGKVYPQTFLKSFHSFPRARISATAVFVSSGIWRRAHSSVLRQKLFSVQGFCKLPAIMKSLNQFIVSVCNVVFSVSISHCSHFFPWFLSKTLELSVASSASFETNTQEDSQHAFSRRLNAKRSFPNFVR